MQFKKYLKSIRVNPSKFAKLHGLSKATVCRAAIGRTVRPRTAKALSKATGGVVTLLDLLFPK